MPRQLVGFGRVTVLLLAAGVLAANVVRLPQRVPPPPSQASHDPAVLSEQRFASVRDYLEAAAPRAVVGYVDNALTSESGTERHYLAQFALVPAVLDRDASSHEWVLANFYRPPHTGPMPEGYRVVRDFGDGVWLLRRTSP